MVLAWVDLAAKDVFEGPERLEDLAEVYMLAGRQDEAIDLLERLLKTVYDGSLTREELRISPIWDPLRKNPRLRVLLSGSSWSGDTGARQHFQCITHV